MRAKITCRPGRSRVPASPRVEDEIMVTPNVTRRTMAKSKIQSKFRKTPSIGIILSEKGNEGKDWVSQTVGTD